VVAVALFGTGNSTTASSAAALSLAVAKPANVSDGDLLIAVAYSQFSTGATTVPNGWTLVPGTAFTAKTGGIYYRTVPSAAAETATSYTWTFNGSGRITLNVFRVTGADLTAPIDAPGTMAVQGAGSTTIPSVTAISSSALLLVVSYWNNSTNAVSVASPPAGMTDGQQVVSPTTGSTSGIDVAYQQLSAVGATGTRLITFNPTATTSAGTLFTINPAPAPHVPGLVDTWLQQSPLYVAHRGGSANWPEETLYGYTQAAAWASPSVLAFEVSVWMSSDGVFVASHDQTTGRVFNGTSYDINVTPWATLQSLTTKVGGYPIARLDALLAAFPDRVWFVENKGSSGITSFFNLLDANGGSGRIVSKQPADNIPVNAEARARGYKTWGYYFESGTSTIASTQSRWDLLGEDYTASPASWAEVKSYGKPVLAHIVATAANKALADTYSPAGYMASGVMEVVPPLVVPTNVTVTATLVPRRWAGKI
jgi:Glycerophosphoryl diester phosphodiesterase